MAGAPVECLGPGDSRAGQMVAPGRVSCQVQCSAILESWYASYQRQAPDPSGCHGQRRPGTGKRRGRRVGDRWRGWRVDGLACWRTVALSLPAEALPGVRESVGWRRAPSAGWFAGKRWQTARARQGGAALGAAQGGRRAACAGACWRVRKRGGGGGVPRTRAAGLLHHPHPASVRVVQVNAASAGGWRGVASAHGARGTTQRRRRGWRWRRRRRSRRC